MINKQDALKFAIEITKESARAGSGISPELMIERVFNKLVELLPSANAPITD
jgi:hypothetical protein